MSDILNIWRHSCYGSDPSTGDYNFDYAETSKREGAARLKSAKICVLLAYCCLEHTF